MKSVIAEVTIDLDEKRRIWTQVTAEEVEQDEVHAMMAAATESALRAHETAVERIGLPPGLRPKQPSTATFGSED